MFLFDTDYQGLIFKNMKLYILNLNSLAITLHYEIHG